MDFLIDFMKCNDWLLMNFDLIFFFFIDCMDYYLFESSMKLKIPLGSVVVDFVATVVLDPAVVVSVATGAITVECDSL